MCKQADKIGRSARAEPVVVNAKTVKSVEQTERIVDARHTLAEVISVILASEPLAHLIRSALVFNGKVGYRTAEIMLKLILRYAAERLVACVHADVLGLVETAEHADLRELGYAR